MWHENRSTYPRSRRRRIVRACAIMAFGVAIGTSPSRAKEFPAGEPLQKNGLQVMAVYLQPVEMESARPNQDPAKTDIHLEADIKALKDNPTGFAEDGWIPYLTVRFTLTKKGSAWRAEGVLHPMVASDGPHYGANVRLEGPGAYDLTFRIEPPAPHAFMRHIDKETGVKPWWTPFEYKGEFKFIGVGKKGTY